MSDIIETIDSRAAFRDHLRVLLDAAESSDVDVRGAYGVRTTRAEAHYDVEVTAVDKREE